MFDWLMEALSSLGQGASKTWDVVSNVGSNVQPYLGAATAGMGLAGNAMNLFSQGGQGGGTQVSPGGGAMIGQRSGAASPKAVQDSLTSLRTEGQSTGTGDVNDEYYVNQLASMYGMDAAQIRQMLQSMGGVQ